MVGRLGAPAASRPTRATTASTPGDTPPVGGLLAGSRRSQCRPAKRVPKFCTSQRRIDTVMR